jgi:hypothetical protein
MLPRKGKRLTPPSRFPILGDGGSQGSGMLVPPKEVKRMQKKCAYAGCKKLFTPNPARPAMKFHDRRCKELDKKQRLQAQALKRKKFFGRENSVEGHIAMGDMEFIKSLGYETQREALSALRAWQKEVAIDSFMMEKWYKKAGGTWTARQEAY